MNVSGRVFSLGRVATGTSQQVFAVRDFLALRSKR